MTGTASRKRTGKLRTRRDFQTVLAQGKTWYSPLVRLVVQPHRAGQSRFGLVTARRLGKAVVRNRVRRRLRESLRLHAPYLPAGVDVVLIAQGRAGAASFWELHQCVHDVLRRAGLLSGDEVGLPTYRRQEISPSTCGVEDEQPCTYRRS